MGAIEMPAARVHAGADRGGDIWRQCCAGKWNAGRYLVPAGTRASANTSGPDPIGQEVAGGIADFKRSAPNEENSFLLPDRLRSARGASLKVRSSRLTWCLADTLFASLGALRIELGSTRSAPNDVAGNKAAGIQIKASLLLLRDLAGLLRSLLHCALRLLSLLSFLSHVALL